MPADLSGLDPDFRIKLESLLSACATQGAIMRPTESVRDPWTQARYWRQSRSSEQIHARTAQLRTQGANFLADVIESVGPQSGDPVTNSIPGLSWHQWGEACDCVWLVGGHAVWDPDAIIDGVNGYRLYAQLAPGLTLTAGGNWPSFKDWPHVQLRSANSPLSFFSIVEIDQRMRQKFPNQPPPH